MKYFTGNEPESIQAAWRHGKEEKVGLTRYYVTLEQELANYPMPGFPVQLESREAYEAWEKIARGRLRELLGFDKMRPGAAEATLISVTPMDDYRREKWVIQTEPGIYMPFYLLIPGGMKPGEKRAAVLCPHGHAGSKDAPAGNAYFPEMARQIQESNYAYGEATVKMGFIAVCPDARGFGERREPDVQGDRPEQRLGCSCAWLNHMANPLGRCVAGMWAWDLMRLLDWILTHEDVDAEHIASIGLSGGALQTIYFSALDDRVCYTVLSGYFYGFKEALLELHNCACNYIPHLWEHFDIGELGALIAPRPLVIETGTQDPLNGKSGLQNVIPYVEQVRKVFALYNREADFFHDIFEGAHRWHGVESMNRLKQYMSTQCRQAEDLNM